MTQVKYVVNRDELQYDHSKFNEAIEVVIKMLIRLDRFDRAFAVDWKTTG